MNKKIVALLVLICLLAGVLSACGKDKEINIIYPIVSDPECVDPQIAETDSAKLIVQNCMEGLVRIGSDGKILPGVAEKWEVSEDGLTYTFHLRSDTNWQTLRSHKNVLGEDYAEKFNTKVTAQDVVFGIRRALRPETKAEDAYLLFPIKNAEKVYEGSANEKNLGISAPDDSTVVIELQRAYPDLLRVLTYPMCMPCNEEFFEATGAKYGLELKYTLCNGPFYIGKWVSDGSLTLYKNEGYKGSAAVGAQAVYLNINANEQQRISKFNQGDYNVISLTAEQYGSIKKSDEINVLSSNNITEAFIFNFNDKYLSNDNIRKALIHATDVSDFSKDGNTNLCKGLVPDSCRWGESSYRDTVGKVNLPVYSADTASNYFKKGLDELDTTNISVTILCPEKYRNSTIRAIQRWEEVFGLSITVSVKATEREDIEKAVADGDYQIALYSLAADDDSALKFLNRFNSQSDDNFAKFEDADYDKLISDCMSQSAGEDICSSCKYAEQFLVNNGIVYPVFYESSYIAFSGDANGVYAIAGLTVPDFSLRKAAKQ